MIAADEDGLICDFAETYHIYDYRSLPVHLAAIYAVGLPDDSRVKRKIRGDDMGSIRALLAMIYDAFVRTNWIRDDEPTSVVDLMFGAAAEPEKKEISGEVRKFDSPEEFEHARKEMIGR